MMFPLVLDLAADPIHKIPVAATCRVLGFSKQAFYAWKKQPVTQRGWGVPLPPGDFVRWAIGTTRT